MHMSRLITAFRHITLVLTTGVFVLSAVPVAHAQLASLNVASASPRSVTAGQPIVLRGSNFPSMVIAQFSGPETAEVRGASPNGEYATIFVPRQLATGTYQLQVRDLAGRTSSAGAVSVTGLIASTSSSTTSPTVSPRPSTTSSFGIHITSISPTAAHAGSRATIYGEGFRSYNEVELVARTGGQTVTVGGATVTGREVYFTIPAHVATDSYAVTVSSGSVRSNTLSLSVTGSVSVGPAEPVTPPAAGGFAISGIAPNPVQVPQRVTVIGSGFGGYNTLVLRDAATGTVVSVPGTTLDGRRAFFNLPSSLGTGTYEATVEVSGQASNALSLEVQGVPEPEPTQTPKPQPVPTPQVTPLPTIPPRPNPPLCRWPVCYPTIWGTGCFCNPNIR